MPLRFFTLASSLFLSLLFVPGLSAQEESPPAASPSPTKAPGHIRFWNMLPPSEGPMDLRRAGTPPTDPPLAGKSPSYQYNSYATYPMGVYHLTVNKSGQTTPLKVLDLNLQGNFYYTVLVAPTPQGPSVQLVNDTSNPKAPSAVLTIRNYFPGLTVDVFNGTQKLASALTYGESTTVSSLPFDRLSLTMKTILPNKVAAESTAEADFKLARRATLLIIPDDYGRFRPRVTLDGTFR